MKSSVPDLRKPKIKILSLDEYSDASDLSSKSLTSKSEGSAVLSQALGLINTPLY